MDRKRARSALEGKQLPPHFWEYLQSLPQSQQTKAQSVDHRLLDQTASIKTDKQTQSPLLKIFKDIMQREKMERDQERETSYRKEVDKRRLTRERPTHQVEGKPSKCTDTTKSIQVKPNLSEKKREEISREKEARQNTQKQVHEKRSSHTTDRHRTPDYNKSYVTSAEKTSGSRSGSVWKPGCQPIVMKEERRPSHVKTDPVSVAPISLKKKMFWKKKDKMEPESKYMNQYSDVANMEYDDGEDLRRRSQHSSKLKSKSIIKHQGKKNKRSDHDLGAMEDDCCEIICETDDVQDEDGYSINPGGSEAQENITLCPLSLKKKKLAWKRKSKHKHNEMSNNTSNTTVHYSWISNAATKQDGSHCWTNFVTELKKCKGMERAGVTLTLIFLTVLIVGGVMYYYKVSCAPKPMYVNQQYDFDVPIDVRQRVKKSDDYGTNFHSANWDDKNIKTVDGVAGLSDYLGIRDLRELQKMVRNDEPNSSKLQEFIKRLIETDNQIKQIRKGIMGVNVSKDDRYLKSDRYKRSVRWRHGPRLLYKKQKDGDKSDEHTESTVEQEARDAQEEAEITQEKATEVSEHAVSAADVTGVKTDTKKKSNTKKHYIPTNYKSFMERNYNKKTSSNSEKKEHVPKKVIDVKRDIATTKKMDRKPTIAILIPKHKMHAFYDESKRKITKCTHVSKEHKSHEEHLKHPYYKNTEHLDRFLDMLLDVNNASRKYDPQVNDIFRNKKTKCKHPNVVVGPIKLIQEKTKAEQNMDYARDEVAQLKKLFTITQTSSKSTHKTVDDSSVSISTPSLPALVTKTVSPKYDIFMSILTVNPDQHNSVTEDIRSLASDRKLHSRRLMQLEEDAEDIGLAYEDLKEVLADDKIDHDYTNHQADKKSNIDDVVLASEELLQLHVIKPTQAASAKLYNPNWKGPIALYPDELNLLMKPYKYSEKIPIRNNDVPEENGEDESVLNNVDYVEDYSTNIDGIAKRAQAYSDYGVLAKEGDVIIASKHIPSQDLATTKTSDKLRFDMDLNPSIIVKRSKSSKNEPPDIKANKNSLRIGRSLMSVKKIDSDDDFDEKIINDLTNRSSKSRNIKNASIRIKSLTKHKHYKKNKLNKGFLRKLIDLEKKKKNTDSASLAYEEENKNNDMLTTRSDNGDKEFMEDFKFNQNYTQVTQVVDTLSSINEERQITNALRSVLNISLLGDMFQKLKVPTILYNDINEKVERLLATTDVYKKTTENYQVDSTEHSLKTSETTSDILTGDISETTADIFADSVSGKTTDMFDNIVSGKTTNIVTDYSLDVTELTYDSTETSKTTDQFYTNTEPITENIRNSIFDSLLYDEETPKNYNGSTIDEMLALENYMEGEDIILVNDTDLTTKEKDLFTYLTSWLCAIVGAVSNVSTTTVDPKFEEYNIESIDRKYRTRSLKSVDNKHENNTSDNVTDVPTHSASSTSVMNLTITLIHNNMTSKEKEITNDNQYSTEAIANKTLVKRNADAGSNFVYFSDIYDEDYGVDLPFERTSEKRKNKMFLKKQKEWIQKKVRNLNEKLHSYPYNKMLMVKQHSKLRKDAESMMMLNDTRIRRNSARHTRAQNPINGAVIDFNVLNSKMKEICSQAANEVQQMRKIQAREDETSNPTSSLMQQLAQLMSDLVDLQVKQKTCRKLPPDLQEFLVWLTAPEPKQRPISKSLLKPGEVDDEFADAELMLDTNDYGVAGLHDLEATLGDPATTGPSVETFKPLCVDAMRSVEDLLYEYEKLSPENKSKIAGVKDYLNNQLNYLRNQVDLNDLTSVYNAVRFRREANNNAKPNCGRDKRKFVRHFSRKHTKTTANNVDDSQSVTEQLRRVVGESKEASVPTDGRQKIKGKEFVKDNDRDKRNLRDVYYKALSESNKFSTSTTTEKHRQT